jgi:hypothetical protein
MLGRQKFMIAGRVHAFSAVRPLAEVASEKQQCHALPWFRYQAFAGSQDLGTNQ